MWYLTNCDYISVTNDKVVRPFAEHDTIRGVTRPGLYTKRSVECRRLRFTPHLFQLFTTHCYRGTLYEVSHCRTIQDSVNCDTSKDPDDSFTYWMHLRPDELLKHKWNSYVRVPCRKQLDRKARAANTKDFRKLVLTLSALQYGQRNVSTVQLDK